MSSAETATTARNRPRDRLRRRTPLLSGSPLRSVTRPRSPAIERALSNRPRADISYVLTSHRPVKTVLDAGASAATARRLNSRPAGLTPARSCHWPRTSVPSLLGQHWAALLACRALPLTTASSASMAGALPGRWQRLLGDAGRSEAWRGGRARPSSRATQPVVARHARQAQGGAWDALADGANVAINAWWAVDKRAGKAVAGSGEGAKRRRPGAA